MSDDNLMALLARVPLRSLVLLEDIDAAFAQREKADGVGNKLTFSGLLNALDGAGSKDGTMLFMTTNYIEKLDPALIRPGRADMRVKFSLATPDQAARMFQAFFPDATHDKRFGQIVGRRQMTMAEIQQHLILHQTSPVEALAALHLPDTAESLAK
jgi:chaperone BCS1